MSGIILKTPEEIELMRESGRLVAQALELARKIIAPGITTKELDIEIEKLILSAGAIPTFKGYPCNISGGKAFSGCICASVNEEVVHGIPGDLKLKDGDIISVDVGVHLNGWCGDAAKTFPVGNITKRAKKLLEVTENSLFKAIENVKPGNYLKNISSAVQKEAESNGYSVVTQFVGHGIGKEMHESPQVPNYIPIGSESAYFASALNLKLQPGLVLAIEPMVNEGRSEVLVDKKDKWTVYTKDRSLSAHFEHSVAVTENGNLILTEL